MNYMKLDVRIVTFASIVIFCVYIDAAQSWNTPIASNMKEQYQVMIEITVNGYFVLHYFKDMAVCQMSFV